MEAEAPAGVLPDQAIDHIDPGVDQLTTLEPVTEDMSLSITVEVVAQIQQMLLL